MKNGFLIFRIHFFNFGNILKILEIHFCYFASINKKADEHFRQTGRAKTTAPHLSRPMPMPNSHFLLILAVAKSINR